MIWLRRFFAVIIGVIFIVLFLVSLVSFRVNSTVLSPGFYTNEIQKADIYNFMYDQAIPVAVDQNIKDVNGLPLDVSIKGTEVAQAVKTALPPDWLQAQTNTALNQVIPYLTGSSDHFSIDVRISDRIKALDPALKQELINSSAYNALSTPAFADRMNQYLNDFGALPFGIQVTGAQVATLLQQVFPPSWLQQTVESNIDSMTSYLTSDQQTIISIPIKDRVEVALSGSNAPVKKFLSDIGAYDEVYKEGIVPYLADAALQNSGTLNFPITGNLQISISKDQLVSALQQVPPADIQAVIEGYIDQLTSYITGASQHFSLGLSSADVVRLGTPVVTNLVSTSAKNAYDNLPACTVQQALDLAKNGISGNTPLCRPPGFSIQEIQTAMGIPGPTQTQAQLQQECGCDLTLALQPVSFDELLTLTKFDLNQQVSNIMSQFFPGTIAFTDTDLRNILSPDDQKMLDKALDWTRNGFVYTDANLRSDIQGQNAVFGSSNIDTLNNVLKWTRSGGSVTEQNLRNFLSTNDPSTLQNLDTARSKIHLAKTLLPFLYLVLALFLVVIGFLGGRSWGSRLAWAAAFLLIGSAIAFAAFGPVYSSVAEPRIKDSLNFGTSATDQLGTLISQKGTDVTIMVASDFVSGIEKTAIILLVVSVVAIGGGIALMTMKRGQTPPKNGDKSNKDSEEQGESNAGSNSANG